MNTATTPTFSEFEAEALASGFDQVVERRWQPGQVIDTHTHPFAVKALMTHGDLWLSAGDVERHLRAGDRFELAYQEPHAERYGPDGAVFWAARRHSAAPR